MWWKVFDLVPGWVYAAIVAALLLLSGVFYVRMNHAVTSLATYKTEVAENTRKAEAEARQKEQEMQEHVNQIARDAQKRQETLAANAARSRDVANGLRDEIARLNAGPMPEDSRLASCTGEARAARELLGTCAERYRGVAEAADGFRDQVTGFQEFAKSIKR